MDNKILEKILECVCQLFSGMFIGIGMLFIGGALYVNFFTGLLSLSKSNIVILTMASIGGLGMFLNTLHNAYCEIRDVIKKWQK